MKVRLTGTESSARNGCMLPIEKDRDDQETKIVFGGIGKIQQDQTDACRRVSTPGGPLNCFY